MDRLRFLACLILVGLLLAVCLPQTAWAQTSTFYPAEGEFAAVFVEDDWPCVGDRDYNDSLLRVNVEVLKDAIGGVTGIQYEIFPQALGSGFIGGGLGLCLPGTIGEPPTCGVLINDVEVTLEPDPNESDTVLWLTDDLRSDLCMGESGFINTDPALSPVACDTMRVEIRFDIPQVIEDEPSFDLFFTRDGQRDHQIHQSEYYGTDQMDTSLFGTGDDASDPPPADGGTEWFVNSDGVPWVVLVPDPVDHPDIPGLLAYPAEGASFYDAFPEYLDFIQSDGTLFADWYEHPDPAFLYVPEPATASLLALAGLAVVRRRR